MAEKKIRTCDMCGTDGASPHTIDGNPIDLCDSHYTSAKFQAVWVKANELAVERGRQPRASDGDKSRWDRLVVGV